MDWITWLGRLVGLVGAGMVVLGALLMMDRTAYTASIALMMVGLMIILADMAIISYIKRQSGLGVIY